MKKLLITLLLTAFCWSAFATMSPPQDTTRKKQDTTKKHPVKSKMKKKKFPGKDTTHRDSTRRKPGDTTKRVPPGM
jgi:hypothetical protein